MTHEEIKGKLEDIVSWQGEELGYADTVTAMVSDLNGLIRDLGHEPKTIEEFDDAITELRKQIVDLVDRRDDLRVKVFAEQTGLAVGAKVTVDGKPGVVDGHKADFLRVVPIVRLYKKDGTLGVERAIFWDKVELT